MKKDQIYALTYFRNNENYIATSIRGQELRICKKTLKSFFSIPTNVTEIHLCLSHKETPESYLVNTNDHLLNFNKIKIKLSNGNYSIPTLFYTALLEVRKFGFPCYVSVEYNDHGL